MFKVFEKQCEPGQEGEPNTINVSVTGDMTREQVVEEVQRQLKAMEANQIRLQDGFYKVNDSFAQSWKIEGEKIVMEDPYDAFDLMPSLKYGDFGKIKILIHLGSMDCLNKTLTQQEQLVKKWRPWLGKLDTT